MSQKQRPQQSAPAKKGGGNRAFLIVIALIVVAGVGWLVMARGGGIGSTTALPTPQEFEGIAATVEADKSSGLVQGSPDAPVEILEFADYSCPHCGTFSGFAGKLLRQNYVEPAGGPVRWITFDFVLGGFPNTVSASMAARCAGEQGAYWAYHDMLFSRQNQWARSPNPAGAFNEIAEDVGLDTGQWGECMTEGRYIEQIAAARKYGESLGVGSTPTLFINGERIDLGGVEPYSHIEGLIQAELAASSDGSEGAATGGDSGGGR